MLEGQRLGVKPWLMDSQDRQRRDEHEDERPDAGSQGSSSSSQYDGWQQQPESEDCSMEEPGDGATQESADCDMVDEDGGSQQCQPEPGDEGDVDDAGWGLFESERSLGSDFSDSDDADCMEDDGEADADRPSRRRRGKRNLSVRCRWKQEVARRTEQQQSQELITTEGEREHEELSMDGIESSVSDAADDERAAEEAAKADARESTGGKRERGTRGMQSVQRKRKFSGQSRTEPVADEPS